MCVCVCVGGGGGLLPNMTSKRERGLDRDWGGSFFFFVCYNEQECNSSYM